MGSNVLKQLVAKGVPAISISRSGTTPKQLENEAWAKDVMWTAGNALEPETYASALAGARALIVTVGSPPVPTSDVAWQLKMNGTTNATAIEAAGEAGVGRVVLLGATTPAWAPEGYVKGKAMGEAAARKFVEEAASGSGSSGRGDDSASSEGDGEAGGGSARSAMVLKPGVIYGTRYEKGVPIPLGVLFRPVSWLMRTASPVLNPVVNTFPYVLKGAVVPPASVENVAAAAVDGATADEYSEGFVTMLPDELAVYMAK